MRSHILFTALLLAAAQVHASGNPHAQADADAARASMQVGDDPLATVYIVSSQKTHQNIRDLTRGGASRFDSLGNPLVISETQAHRLDEVAERIHQKERRCGGYFAFGTHAEAVAFVNSDSSIRAMSTSMASSYTIDNPTTVSPWLSQVSETNIYNTISHLQSYKNRYYASSYGKSAAEWIKAQWAGLANGRTDVTAELFSGCTNCSTQPSVILTVQGTDLPDEVVVLGAHLDSINSSGAGSSEQNAPGADDDASGIATLSEIIRVSLSNGWKPRRTVKFMGYAAEEVGLRGSYAIAQSFKASGTNVVGVLQLDMTNYRSGTPETIQLVTDYSNADLKTYFNSLFDTYLAPLGLTRGTITCGYGCSDHASWTNAGFPAAMMFESGDDAGKNTSAFTGYNPKIHTSGDTLANMGNSAAPSVPFAQFGLAFLGELAKTGNGGIPNNNPPTANFSSSVNGLAVQFSDTSTDSDGSIASRSWDFGDGSSSSAANPNKTYSAAGTYTVTLSVIDDDGATGSRTAPVTVSSGGGAPCTGCTAYSGSLSGSGDSDIQPGGTYYQSSGSGSHQGWLEGPPGTDFDLRLYKWSGSSWAQVANSAGNTSSEQVSYNGTAGYYYWKIESYSGSGSYQFWLKRP